MALIHVILILAVIGFLVWLITKYVPMPELYKTLILVVAIICTLIWLLGVLGVIGDVTAIRVGR